MLDALVTELGSRRNAAVRQPYSDAHRQTAHVAAALARNSGTMRRRAASRIAFSPGRRGVSDTAACAVVNQDSPPQTLRKRQDFVSFFSLSQPKTLANATLRTLRTLDTTQVTSRLGRAAKPSERYRIHAPIAEVVYADLRRRSAEHQTTVSRLAADLIAIITGYPELADEFDPVTLC